MISRRTILSAVSVIATPAIARAQDWKAAYPEIVLSVAPSENATEVLLRWGPFADYLSRAIGTKVTLRIANDYAAVIEGQKAGNVHVAIYGPASFAKARMIGVPTDAFCIRVNGDGSKGYYSVFYVLARSPYQSVADLKGRNLGLVDPNSTSGYNMPLFALNKLGIKPETYFSKVVITGSHENAVIALAQGTVDVCANAWNAPDNSFLYRMVSRGMVRDASGAKLGVQDFRIVLKSDLIINSPVAMLSALPEPLKARIRDAFLNAATNAPKEFAGLSDGKSLPWVPVTNAEYDDTIKLVKFVDGLRKA